MVDIVFFDVLWCRYFIGDKGGYKKVIMIWPIYDQDGRIVAGWSPPACLTAKEASKRLKSLEKTLDYIGRVMGPPMTQGQFERATLGEFPVQEFDPVLMGHFDG